jgi:glycosyltransferase involved in cell wall biosynthesis
MSVSVVIPAHNAGGFIEEAIRSVLGQAWPVDEIIVVNDGSTDRDYVELTALASNLRVVDQPNRGVSAARNRGCMLANSTYVAVLDADDVWVPGKLAAQMRYLAAHPECDAVFCQGRWWYPQDGGGTWSPPQQLLSTVPENAPVRQLYYSDFLFGLPVATGTMVIKKSVWLGVGGFEEGRRYAEDQDFYLRLSYAHNLALIDVEAILYRQHRFSATRRLQEANHWADVIARAASTLGLKDGARGTVDAARLHRRLAELHIFHGRDHFWHGDIEIARREFRRALDNRPMDPKTGAYLVLSALPGVPQLLRRLLNRQGSGGTA